MSLTTNPSPVASSSVLHANLATNPPRIIKAQGNYLTTSDRYSIIDASGGAAVSCIGHNHPRVKKAIADQLDAVEYCFSPWFTTPAYERLSNFLTESTGGAMSKVFVCGSGAEAVEAALKMARQYFMELPVKQPQRTKFISRDRSYHGNTLGALAVSGHQTRRAIYEPILSREFSQVSPCYPYRGVGAGETEARYAARLARELEDEFQRLSPGNVCAFVAETVAGLTLGGVPPVRGYLKAMQEVCHRHGALFILDEVFAGMGRTGTLHAWEQEGVIPDLQTVAKGLGPGYQPVGALMVGSKVVDVLSKGSGAFVHFQTWHGHPVACAAAYEVQQVIKNEGLVENCRVLGEYLGQLLQNRLAAHKNVGQIRGRGLVWGIELVQNKSTKQPFPASAKIAPAIHAKGLSREIAVSIIPGGGVADGTDGDLLVLAPAYNITTQDADVIVERTARALEAVLGPTREARL